MKFQSSELSNTQKVIGESNEKCNETIKGLVKTDAVITTMLKLLGACFFVFCITTFYLS